MCPNRIYEPIKLGRERYFVEYRPPKDNSKFATLFITFIGNVDKAEVIQIMEMELGIWVDQYPCSINGYSI